MQVSFHTKSSSAEPTDKTPKEIRKAIQQVVPSAQVSVAKVNDTVVGFFSNGEIEGLSPSLLLDLVKKMAPQGVVVDWNFKNAPEEAIKDHFLIPAPQSREIKLKGFQHLTPSFMESLADARPNLRKIDLRKTKGTAQLLEAFLSKQLVVLSHSNQEVQKELREKIGSRSGLIESRNDANLKIENLKKEQEALTKEIEVLKDLAQKAHAAAKESPTVQEYGKKMDQKAAELFDKLSALHLAVSKETGALEDLTAQIASLNGAIDGLRSRFLDLDSVAVEVLIEGGDVTPEQKKELYHKYPHIVLTAEDTTLDLSHSRLSIRQVWNKLERLPHVKEVHLTEHQGPLDLFDIVDLEEKKGVHVLYSAPLFLAPSKKISIEGEFKPLSTELLSRVLHRFPEVETVSLTDWKDATPLDALCLQETFPGIKFSFPLLERCEFPLFDTKVIEAITDRFPTVMIQLKETTVEQEKEVLALADVFEQVDFRNDTRVDRLLENSEICKHYLKRALRKNVKTSLSSEELRSLAIQRPNLATLIERIIGYREGKVRTGLTDIHGEIEKIDFAVSPIQEKPSSKQEIPYALWILIGKLSSDPTNKNTALKYAVQTGNADMAKALIERGADVNHKDSQRITPLFFTKTAEVAKLLIEKGADVKHEESGGRTPLFGVKSANLAKFLIEKGLDVNHEDRKVCTPLFYARNAEVAKFLIENGAVVDHQDSHGATPLFYAQNADVAKFLIENGADVNYNDSMGRTPLFFAKNTEVAKLLIEKGADVNHNDEHGRTPLTYAREENSRELAEFFEMHEAKK